MKQLYIFSIFVSSIVTAQNVNGIIYNTKTTVEAIKVENLSTKNTVFTNKKGEFVIAVKVNDTLEISSIFYVSQTIVVKPLYLNETFVIQLKEAKNTLDEVKITSTEKEKVANITEINVTMRNQILEDIKRRPHLYGRAPSGNIDFVKIIGLIGKLFNKKYKDEPFTPISYKDIASLFKSKHKLFNDNLLIETLNIENDKKFLFFEFIEAKNINSKLLDANKELELLENIITVGNEFTTIIKNFQKEKSD